MTHSNRTTGSPLDVFRRLTVGVYVIGVAHAGQTSAFTAAWVMQVSFDPLLIALSVNPDHASWPLLRESRAFVVNVLRDGQLEAARHFGTLSSRLTDKLAGRSWVRSASGAPILSDAAAYMECHVTEIVPAGDHMVVLAQPTGGSVLDDTAQPMSYGSTGNMDGSAELYPAGWS